MSAADLVPSSIRERVAVAPPAAWIACREEALPASTATIPGTNPTVLLDRRNRVRSGESYERVVLRLDTMQAVHDAAQWRLSFDPDAQHLTIHALIVRRGSAATDHAQPEAIRLLQREEGLDRLKIDGWVTAVVVIEDVRVGDLLDVSFTLRSTPRLLPERFWLFETVGTGVALHRFRLEVRFPASETMQWKSSSARFAPSAQEADGETVWTWSLDEAPAEVAEPQVPTWHFTHHWLQVSDLMPWGEVAAGIADAWSEQFASPELTQLATEIAARATTLAERADAALTFVQDEIRYLSVNTGLGGYVPAPPGTVLRRRFGDCKDKSFLAAHLLRQLGLPARAILVSTGLRQTVQTLLPMPSAFDHAVVEYEIDGHRRWADATLSQQGGGALARVVPNFRHGLPVAPGVTELETQPPAPDTHDRYELHETFFVDTAHGVSTLRVLVTARGRDADALRARFAHDGAETVARERFDHYRGTFPHLSRVGRMEWRDDRARNEFLLGEVYDAERLLTPGASAETGTFTFPAHLIRSHLTVPNVARRRQPLAVAHPCNLDHLIEIESPAIARAEGHTARSGGPPFQLTYATTQQPGRYAARYTLRTTTDSVPPDKFASYQKKVDEALAWTVVSCTLPMSVAVPWSNRQHGQLLPRPRPATPPDPNLQRLPPQLGEIAPPLTSRPPQPALPPTEIPMRLAPIADPVHEPESLETDDAPRRQRRRKQRKKRSHEGLWIAVGILLIIIAGLAVVFLVGRQDPPPSPIVSGAKPSPPPLPPAALGRPDIPLTLPGNPAAPPVNPNFFPSQPGPLSRLPITPPPERPGQLPQ